MYRLVTVAGVEASVGHVRLPNRAGGPAGGPEQLCALSAAESDSAAARQIRMFAVGRRVNGCASSANSCSA
jgi:hypothetical protein